MAFLIIKIAPSRSGKKDFLFVFRCPACLLSTLWIKCEVGLTKAICAVVRLRANKQGKDGVVCM